MAHPTDCPRTPRTIRQTLAAIRALGLIASWDCYVREFRITTSTGTRAEREARAYYTPHIDDAIRTAEWMAKHPQAQQETAR